MLPSLLAPVDNSGPSLGCCAEARWLSLSEGKLAHQCTRPTLKPCKRSLQRRLALDLIRWSPSSGGLRRTVQRDQRLDRELVGIGAWKAPVPMPSPMSLAWWPARTLSQPGSARCLGKWALGTGNGLPTIPHTAPILGHSELFCVFQHFAKRYSALVTIVDVVVESNRVP